MGNPRGKGFPDGPRPLALAVSAGQALFQVFDPDLERGDVLLQCREIALQDLAARPVIGRSRLNAT